MDVPAEVQRAVLSRETPWLGLCTVPGCRKPLVYHTWQGVTQDFPTTRAECPVHGPHRPVN
jgi:hypothetical protein